MRPLKFRVYVPEFSRFVYFDLGDFNYSDRYLHQSDIPVQQFTGLNDKNNKPIYGGRLKWAPWIENSGDVFGIEAEWQKGANITGRVLGLYLGWRVSYHGDDIPTNNPDFLLDFYGKVQVGTYKAQNGASTVEEDIKSNTVLVGTTLSLM